MGLCSTVIYENIAIFHRYMATLLTTGNVCIKNDRNPRDVVAVGWVSVKKSLCEGSYSTISRLPMTIGYFMYVSFLNTQENTAYINLDALIIHLKAMLKDDMQRYTSV